MNIMREKKKLYKKMKLNDTRLALEMDK